MLATVFGLVPAAVVGSGKSQDSITVSYADIEIFIEYHALMRVSLSPHGGQDWYLKAENGLCFHIHIEVIIMR